MRIDDDYKIKNFILKEVYPLYLSNLLLTKNEIMNFSNQCICRLLKTQLFFSISLKDYFNLTDQQIEEIVEVHKWFIRRGLYGLNLAGVENLNLLN
ncbi:MAG: hypothetical protein NZ928_01570 [Endomicrobia bacterium]|nr:hypothetical protein [Endomicrobiia bacterium]MDW8056362.1 hypothetical protein [Elusimicrobiota bacterium]